MTLSDKIGKRISRSLYRRATRNPGRPGPLYENEAKALRFCREWPWSWGKGRASRLLAIARAI